MQFRTIIDLLSALPEKYGDRAMLTSYKQGKWEVSSVEKVFQNVTLLSYGLLAQGVKPGDRIAVISGNRQEWNFIDLAILQIGAISVPLYPTLSDADMLYILQNAAARMVFVSDEALFEKIQRIKAQLPALTDIYTFDELASKPDMHLKTLRSLGKNNPDPKAFTQRKAAITKDALLTIIYTSGTTGKPKGVMLSHGNILSNVAAMDQYVPLASQRALSFLPLSHVFERIANYFCMSRGISIYYARSLELIGEDLLFVKPHFFCTVPRLLEKIYDKIVVKGSFLTGIKRQLFYWALHLGLRYELHGKNGCFYALQLALANSLVFSKWREALGGNVKVISVGGAKLQPRLSRVFWAAKIPVLEGYGLTEASPVVTANAHAEIKFGTVGKAINGVQIQIAPDGEVLCKGPNVMQGYYQNEVLTKAALPGDGSWLHTGDIGEIDTEGYLRITDRKKEMFKTAGGKYVAPGLLESKIKESLLIEQVMVIGENERFPAALIVPAFVNLQEWCKRHSLVYTNPAEMVVHPRVLAKFEAEVTKLCSTFSNWEQVKKFVLLTKEWSVDEGEVTPKLSLKRKVILAKNKDLIEGIYR